MATKESIKLNSQLLEMGRLKEFLQLESVEVRKLSARMDKLNAMPQVDTRVDRPTQVNPEIIIKPAGAA